MDSPYRGSGTSIPSLTSCRVIPYGGGKDMYEMECVTDGIEWDTLLWWKLYHGS